MNATRTLKPRANSPPSVAGPSANTWPFTTWSPRLTIGFWLKHVDWLERRNLFKRYVSTRPSLSRRTWISLPQQRTTLPASRANTQTPESVAAVYSIPVPTKGA